MLKLAKARIGTVSELMDMVDAVTMNTKVRVAGLWWTLGSITPQARERVLEGMYSGEYKYVTDWAGVGKSLLINEVIDHP